MRILRIAALLLAVATIGCGSDGPTEPPPAAFLDYQWLSGSTWDVALSYPTTQGTVTVTGFVTLGTTSYQTCELPGCEMRSAPVTGTLTATRGNVSRQQVELLLAFNDADPAPWLLVAKYDGLSPNTIANLTSTGPRPTVLSGTLGTLTRR